MSVIKCQRIILVYNKNLSIHWWVFLNLRFSIRLVQIQFVNSNTIRESTDSPILKPSTFHHTSQFSNLMSMHFFYITINLYIKHPLYINSCFKTTQPYCCDTCTLNIKANKSIVHFVPENKISDKPPTRKPCSWAPLRIV